MDPPSTDADERPPTRLRKPQPRAQAVADELRLIVKERHLVPGDRLPSETELIGLLGVGRSSVREGIQLLESLGIIEVEHGKGSFLASTIGGGLGRVIDWAYSESDRTQLARDLLEARLIFEPWQARLAALRATDDEIATLLSIKEPRYREAEKIQAAGLDYHHYIARIAHNEILLIMSNAVRPLYISLVEHIPRTADQIAQLVSYHEKISDAISRRDADGAAEAMRAHLEENGRSTGILIGGVHGD